MTDQRTAAALPVAPGSGSRLLAVALLVLAAVGAGRVLLRLGAVAVLGAVVLGTVVALAGGILVLRTMLGP